METVVECESPRSAATSALEQERMRMQAAVMKASAPDQHPGSRRPNNTNRVARRTPARAASLRPTAPTKSNDALASMRGNAVARANSSRALLRATSSGNISRGVGRNTSAASGIRPYSRDQIVNTSIQRAGSNEGMKMMARCGPGGSTLERGISDLSLGDFSQFSHNTSADNSILTMDSVNLRKTQMVADPLENEGTYDEDDSFADHESFVTRESDATFFRQLSQQRNTVLTFDDLEAMRMREKVHISAEESSQFSFGTIGSGLTNDYTYDHEESEFVQDETELAE